MPKTLFLLCLMPAFLAGCTRSQDDATATASAPARPAPADMSATRGGDDRMATAAKETCILTQPIQSRAPEGTDGGPPGPEARSWFVNAGRTIWMYDTDRTAGQRTKTAWFRPARVRLEVSGRRLDAPAPPLRVEINATGDAYRNKFQPSNLTFPTEGCWEITAKAGESEARFVVEVKRA